MEENEEGGLPALDVSVEAGDEDDAMGSASEEEEAEQFDISLAASHSYMGAGLVAVRGRRVLEAGWRGRVPVVAHHGAVFPGETVPMLLPRAAPGDPLVTAVRHDRMFGLLCPDESGAMMSGYGVLCEVFEVGGAGAGAGDDDAAMDGEGGAESAAFTLKARAVHRFRLVEGGSRRSHPAHVYARARLAEVRVLPELAPRPPTPGARLDALAALRGNSGGECAGGGGAWSASRVARTMDAALTAWPVFVYDIFDYERMRRVIEDYFRTLMLADKLPSEPVSLSFWVASNLALSARDRLQLFAVDSALLRLRMEVRLIAHKSVLCCGACLAEIARREHIFAMSSEGVHSNYTNLSGFMHDIVTVSRAQNTSLSGAPSAEFSWFPGYTWTIALCAACMAHVGWRFDAQKRALRPQQFYGLCRNYVQPRADSPSAALDPRAHSV